MIENKQLENRKMWTSQFFIIHGEIFTPSFPHDVTKNGSVMNS